MVELVKGISKLPDRRLEADRPRHSIQFINDSHLHCWWGIKTTCVMAFVAYVKYGTEERFAFQCPMMSSDEGVRRLLALPFLLS
ncbi:hypothetical protein TNCV_2291241 [Trichonephila clavipes]|uniref:Uncharacterized protein n=1 Tax=Trichonephila clavipes TaxID=2585209 RepID=A0A8X6RJ43_TRICX|nr:hypothetical protein TNCV_2291241 [Trichonephila clavipes]